MSAPARRSAALRKSLRVRMPALFEASRRVAEHPDFARIYADYLFVLHSMMRAAVSLMAEAVAQLEARPADAVSRPLVQYFRRHLVEEEGHDVWVLEDLEELGIRREEVLRRMPSPTVAQLVGAQYYWMRHYDPVALLGYMMVLEGYPSPAEAVEDLVTRSGVSPAAFRTMRRHAADDVDHSRDLDRLIDRLPLTEQQFELVWVNASMTASSLTWCARELVDEVNALAHRH